MWHCHPNDSIHSEQVGISRYKPHWEHQMRPMFMNTLPDMIFIDAVSIVCGIAPHNDWIHSEQVWVSGYKPQWNNQMAPISMKSLRDMIAIDVMRTLCNIDRHIDWIYSHQVWVSGYKPLWNNQMTPIFMKTLPDMIVIDVMRSLCGIDHQIDCIHSQQVWVSGYQPQWNKWRPFLLKHYQILLPLVWYGPYVSWTVRLIASTVSRYELQDISRNGINDAYFYQSTTRYDCHWRNMGLMYYGPSDWLHPQSAGMSCRI